MKKKLLLCASVAAMMSQMSVAENWVPVTSAEQLDGSECVAVWYFKGAEPAEGMPKRVEPIGAFDQRCVVMAKEEIKSSANKIFRSAANIDLSSISFDRLGDPITISEMPENACIVKFEKAEQGWTMYCESEPVGYFAPQQDLESSNNCLSVSETPWYNRISIGTNGIATITNTERSDKNVFSAFTNFSFTGPSECAFAYIDQALNTGNLYLFTKESGMSLSKLTAIFDPAASSEYAPTMDGKLTIKCTWGGEDVTGTLKNAEAVKGKFAGKDLDASAIVCKEGYPAEIEVTVPQGEEGLLELMIAEGWYELTRGEESAETVGINYLLNVKKPTAVPEDVKYSFTPGANLIYTSLDEIKVDFKGCTAVMNEGVEWAAQLNGENVELPVATDAYTFKYRPEFTGNGVYTLTFARGFWTVTFPNGAVTTSPKISFKVWLQPEESEVPAGWTITPAPGSTVESLREIKFDSDDVLSFEIGTNASETGFMLSFDGYNYRYGIDFSESTAEDSDNIMRFAETITGNGKVNVRIAAGFWKIQTLTGKVESSPAMTYSFYIGDGSGVSVEDATEGVTIYNMQGICLGRNVNKEVVNMLPKGLYIVNGKKIMR